jgi:hypothetical protein
MPFDSTDFALPPIDRSDLEEAVMVLQTARALIADKRDWCRRAACIQHLDGRMQSCAIGALMQASCQYGRQTGAGGFLWRAAEERWFFRNPIEVNDFLGHRATLRMFDRAIALALVDGRRRRVMTGA